MNPVELPSGRPFDIPIPIDADGPHAGRACAVCEETLRVGDEAAVNLMRTDLGIEMLYVRHIGCVST